MANAKCLRCPNVGYTTPSIAGNIPPLLGIGSTLREETTLCTVCRTKASKENEAAKQRSRGRGNIG
jgi:hypothetical protein